MTTDRDIRFSTDQMLATARAIRTRQSQLRRSIARADANRAAGQTIQHRVYEEHVNELYHLGCVLESLEVARQQIARQIAEKLR